MNKFCKTYEGSCARNFFFSAVLWLAISTSIGLVLAIKFVYPDFLKGIPYLSFGRLRPIHVNGVLFGWLSMGYVGAIFYILPRILGVKLYSERLGNITCILWNILIVLAVITLGLGMTQGVEYAELIYPLDILVVILFILLNINAFKTVISRKEPKLFVSAWYILASLLWTPLVYIIGNLHFLYTGVNHAVVNWFYGHNIIGLWFTTAGVGIAYYLFTKLTGNPLYSQRLSLIGFWTIAFVYVWTGQHHLLYGPGPDWLETVAIAFSISLLIPVWTVLWNFFKTMQGKWHLFFESLPVKFMVFGSWWYFLTCLQGPLTNSLRPISKIVHFTNWIVGHAHLAVLGAFTYYIFSAIYSFLPKLTGKDLSARLGLWHFWLTTSGLIVFIVSLWIAGLIQGTMWSTKWVSFMGEVEGIEFIEVVKAIRPYYIIRLFGAALMVIGQWIFFVNVMRNISAGKEKIEV